MTRKTAQLLLLSLPLVLATGWGGFQAVCDDGNPNAMFGRLGPPLWGGVFGGTVGFGFTVLGFFALWFKQYSDNLRAQTDRSSPVVSAIGRSLFLGLIGAVALATVAPSTRFFWYAGPGFPRSSLSLIGYGFVAGAVIGTAVGMVVGFAGSRPDGSHPSNKG